MSTPEPPSSSHIKNQILTENTAQAVLKHLNANHSNRRRALARWIWELLQNARDTSRPDPAALAASIAHEDGHLVFQHTGRPFTMFEVGHLIFHGSTKIEDDDTIGQYGSGFLTTHLISPEIEVSGRLADDRTFQFTIRREAGSVQELSRSMDSAWDEFNASLIRSRPSQEFTTRFRYPVTGDSADAVENGLDALRRCAPFVMVFNPVFSTIEARSGNAHTTFRRIAETPPADQCDPSLVAVLEDRNGHEVQIDYLLKSSERTSVAVPLERVRQTAACISPTGVPRLFLGFPLAGTESFSFPVVINSFDFTPTENRDGIFLAQGTDDANRRNQSIIEEACGLTADLTCFAASRRWRQTHVLVNIPELESHDWLDLEWFRSVMKDRFIEIVRASPSMVTADGEPLPPSESRLPVADTDEGVNCLWRLLRGCKELRRLLPARKEAAGWTAAVKSWVETHPDRDQAPSRLFPEVVDGETLASDIAEQTGDSDVNPELQALQGLLHDGVSALEWLDEFHSFLKDSDLQGTVEELFLVLDQDGLLDSLSRLYRDDGIDGELKNIAESLDWSIRRDLRDVRLKSLADEEGAGSLTDEDVSRKLLEKLDDRANRQPDEKFALASARLFAWLAKRGDWDRLHGFPVFAHEGESESMTIMYTPRPTGDEEPPLGPVMTLPEELRPFIDIFPPSRLMAGEFFKALPDLDVWRTLSRENLVRRNVIAERSVDLRQAFTSEPLPDGDHEAVDAVEVTDVVGRAEVMSRVRGSRQRALLYWRFVVEWLVERDARGLEIQQVDCECGQAHGFYRAGWLEPLRSGGDRWIRLEGDKRHSMSAQSLARLLRDSAAEIRAHLNRPAVHRLLDVIDVSRLDLMQELYSESREGRKQLENAFVQILASAEGDVRRLSCAREYIEDLNGDPGLPEVLAERRERRRVVHANLALGEHVEQLVKEGLEAAEFVVRRTGVGSDFEIHQETDHIVNLEVKGGERTWLVEVKATRDQQGVRMTTAQAKVAAVEGSRFLLCVVPVRAEAPGLEEVRKGMRFVENIGAAVAPLCRDLNELEDLRGEITASELAGVQLELTPNVARIRVASSVWEKEGFRLDDLADRLAAL